MKKASTTSSMLGAATMAMPADRYSTPKRYVLCTRLLVENGQFVGACARPICYGPGKVHYAERFAEQHDIDLANSYFYTDSYSDLPMLQRVGQPRIVNPDRRLAFHARRQGWPIAQW